MNREQLRKQLCSRRKQLSLISQEAAANQIMHHLVNHASFNKSENIAAYLSVNGEVNTGPLIKSIWMKNKTCYLPVVTGKSLQFSSYHENDLLVKNRFNILEPSHTRAIAPKQLDLVLMPLVAVDRRGCRLGMGAGYYDDTFSFLLTDLTLTKPYLMGLAYSWQLVDNLEEKPWDVPLNAVVTEEGVLEFKSMF